MLVSSPSSIESKPKRDCQAPPSRIIAPDLDFANSQKCALCDWETTVTTRSQISILHHTCDKDSITYFNCVTMLLNAETGSSYPSPHLYPRPISLSNQSRYYYQSRNTNNKVIKSHLNIQGPPSPILNMACPPIPRMDAR